jgi:hypothetical protein
VPLRLLPAARVAGAGLALCIPGRVACCPLPRCLQQARRPCLVCTPFTPGRLPPALLFVPSTPPAHPATHARSPTSVVTLRRSQSASESSAAAASDAATAAEGGGGAAAAASVSTPAAADPPMGFGRAPKSLPLDPWAASMARQSSLRTLLMQQEQLTQLHKRLSINTGRSNAGARPSHGPGRGGGRGRSRPDGTRSSASAAAPAAAAGFAQQGCVAAATPCCPEPSGAAAAHAAAAQHTSTFAAAACRAGDGPGELAGTVPSAAMHACARRRRLTLPECGRTAAAPAAVQRPHRSDALGGMLQGEAGVASRRGTAGIDIPERMRRAGSEPHLSDDLIAAAAAAAAAGSSAAAAAALAPAGGPSSSSGGSSQSGSPYVGPSPPKQLPSTVAATGQRAAVTREVLEAQAEAVAASAQARVLQQALEQVGGWGAGWVGGDGTVQPVRPSCRPAALLLGPPEKNRLSPPGAHHF